MVWGLPLSLRHGGVLHALYAPRVVCAPSPCWTLYWSPGIDHMSAVKMICDLKARGAKITSFSSVCGGLPAPEAANNPFGYVCVACAPPPLSSFLLRRSLLVRTCLCRSPLRDTHTPPRPRPFCSSSSLQLQVLLEPPGRPVCRQQPCPVYDGGHCGEHLWCRPFEECQAHVSVYELLMLLLFVFFVLVVVHCGFLPSNLSRFPAHCCPCMHMWLVCYLCGSVWSGVLVFPSPPQPHQPCFCPGGAAKP
jgi:hypothetical protein